MSQVVGTIKEVTGLVGIMKPGGPLVGAKVGDRVEENDVVRTLDPDSALVLELDGGRQIVLGGEEQVLVDQSVFAAVEEGETIDAEALQQALAGGIDLDELEATAAGEELTGDSVEPGTIVERGDARGLVEAGLRGTEFGSAGVEFGAEGASNLPPEAEDDTAFAVEEGKGPQHRYGHGGEHEGEGHDEEGEGGHGHRYQYDAPVQAVGNVLANDSDDNLPNPPSDLDVVNVVSDGTGNLMSIDGDGNFVIVGLYGTLVLNGETGEFVYTVNEKNPDVDSMNYGDSIQDIFTYTVSDSILTDTATLTITINGTNDAPIATADEGFAKERGYMEAGEFASGNVITDSETGDHDVDSDTLLIINLKTGEPHGGGGGQEGGDEPHTMQAPSVPDSDFVAKGTYGTLYMWEDGEYLYVPKNGNPLVDSLNEGDLVQETFTYTVSDGDKYAKTTLTITLEGTNDAPVAHGDHVTISEDQFLPPVTIDALANDTDVDSGDNPSNFSIDAVSIISGDGLVWVHDNQIKYLPDWLANQSLNEGDTKQVIIEYTMSDDSGAPSTSTVTVTIEGVNDRPVAVIDFAQGDENHVFVVPVLANDWDVDSNDNPSNFSLDQISYGGPGTASIVGNQLQFDPGTEFDYLAEGETATVKIWYRMSDDSGAQSNWTAAVLTLVGSNDAPVAVDDVGMINAITYTSTWDYSLNAGNDYTNDHVTISPIHGYSVDGSGPTMGVDGYPKNDSSQMINPGEGIKFEFDEAVNLVRVDFGNFNSHDTALWAVYNGNTLIASGVYTYGGNPNDAILDYEFGTAFDTLVILNTDFHDSFSIDEVLVSNHGSDSFIDATPLYFTEADLLYNDYDPDTSDALNITGLDSEGDMQSTSAFGATVTLDADGNILYDPSTIDWENPTWEAGEADSFTYTISDGTVTDSATVSVDVSYMNADGSYEGDTLLIDDYLASGEQVIDFGNIAAMGNNISFIDLQDGDEGKTLQNLTPENVRGVLADGSDILHIDGEAAMDTVELNAADWTDTGTNVGSYDVYTGSFEGNDVTLYIDTDINVDIIP